MTFPATKTIQLPVEPYNIFGYHFGQIIRRWWILWATHLGDDVACSPGTPIKTIGAGRVVWSQMQLGDELNRNWGGLVIIGHSSFFTPQNLAHRTFYSLYGHLTNLSVDLGDQVKSGQTIGVVAAGSTPENGWWEKPHLHFSIYVGPWQNKVLPGYNRIEERRTKTKWWRDPKQFIVAYNQHKL